MTMTDPIADMLTRLRNANQAYHDAVSMPYSKLKQGVADILKQEGYITSYDVAEPAEGVVGKTLTITLKYGRTREYSRCRRCGRARSVYRKFGLCRICLREMAHNGFVPGMTKSSW